MIGFYILLLLLLFTCEGLILGHSLSENTGLRSLSLAWNSIRGRGAGMLASGLGVRHLMSSSYVSSSICQCCWYLRSTCCSISTGQANVPFWSPQLHAFAFIWSRQRGWDLTVTFCGDTMLESKSAWRWRTQSRSSRSLKLNVLHVLSSVRGL